MHASNNNRLLTLYHIHLELIGLLWFLKEEENLVQRRKEITLKPCA